jgi:hypothetical protein
MWLELAELKATEDGIAAKKLAEAARRRQLLENETAPLKKRQREGSAALFAKPKQCYFAVHNCSVEVRVLPREV